MTSWVQKTASLNFIIIIIITIIIIIDILLSVIKSMIISIRTVPFFSKSLIPGRN